MSAIHDRSRAGLARGPQVRSRRAEIRRAIAAGQIDVPALLEGAGDQTIEIDVLAMSAYDVVANVPGLDRAGLERVLDGRRIYTHTRVGDLTVRTRRAIADSIRKETETDGS